jgi:hypothetical protein
MAEPQFDPTQPFTAAPPFDPSQPFTASAAPTPDFRATNAPPSAALTAAAYGKDAMQLALDALPGAGAVVGGVLATPETLGGGTLVGAALGAGAGRGLRDLISAGLGLEKPSTAIAEGGKIAMDAGETYVAGKVLPALWSAIKEPGATVGDVFDSVRKLYSVTPKALKAFLPDFEMLAKLPKGVSKAPASILERPAWQTWQEHLPDAPPSPPVARATGTSMVPAAVRPMAAPTVMPVEGSPSAMASPVVDVPAPVAAPSVTPPAPAAAETPAPRVVVPPADFQAAQAARTTALPDQKALNELALAARRAAYQASLTPTADTVVPASGKLHFTAPEWAAFRELRTRGLSLEDAATGAKAAGQFARQYGLTTPTLEQTQFPKGTRR